VQKFLIDTNVIVDFLRGKTPLLGSAIGNKSCVSVITLAELYYGAEKSTEPGKSKDKIKEFIAGFDIEVLKVDSEYTKIYGIIRADLEKKGMRLEDLDLLIAATALYENKILVTNNKKHFERIEGLKIAD
jgi:tRNA(fMet)-specific endonuclease VapC